MNGYITRTYTVCASRMTHTFSGRIVSGIAKIYVRRTVWFHTLLSSIRGRISIIRHAKHVLQSILAHTIHAGYDNGDDHGELMYQTLHKYMYPPSGGNNRGKLAERW